MTKQMTCEEVLTLLYDYLDSEIDGPTESDIDTHLHSCRECFSRMEFERLLKRKIVAGAEVETPPRVHKRMQTIIKRF